MIKYRLRCSNGHEFDSWFASSDAYETLEAAGQLSCSHCNDPHISRAIMAPNIVRGHTGDVTGESGSEQSEQQTQDHTQTSQDVDRKKSSLPPMPAEMKALEMVRTLRRHVERNHENVGKDFANQARQMYYGEIEKRKIYGEATVEETRELLDEGIPLMQLPDIREDA